MKRKPGAKYECGEDIDNMARTAAICRVRRQSYPGHAAVRRPRVRGAVPRLYLVVTALLLTAMMLVAHCACYACGSACGGTQ